MIQVEASGDRVTLRGNIRNHAEKDEAERVAWAAPGVRAVDNQLKVTRSWFSVYCWFLGFDGPKTSAKIIRRLIKRWELTNKT